LKLQWHGELVAAPGYTVESPGTLLRVSQARPLLRIENAIGRTFDSPVRKSLRFLVVDGPAATYRKVKGKRLQRALTDDYHVVAISGHRCDTGEPALALACGVPAWAEYLPVQQPAQLHRLRGRAASRICATGEEVGTGKPGEAGSVESSAGVRPL
jgi:hypothetical protein